MKLLALRRLRGSSVDPVGLRTRKPSSARPSARGLEAPHRRLEPGSRLFERAVLRAYRVTSWVLGHAPETPAFLVLATGTQLSYLLWPTKRRWSNANFGHVLGLPPNSMRVRRLALAAYRQYARYLVELMRLEQRPASAVAELVEPEVLDVVEPMWEGAKGGLIFAVAHVGSNEAVAGAIAHRGWPISVVADDSAFPEMFEHLRRQREGWGIKIIAWRNLRQIYGVLRQREMLGLLIDWGYRPDGIPVRLFDAWTTLPAGPATLAAKTGSRIVSVGIRRTSDGRFHTTWCPPIEVASTSPAELVRATQAMADELQRTIAAAPEQWYSFKPMWPATPEESAELERRAVAALAGTGPATPERSATPAAPDGPTAGAAVDQPAAEKPRLGAEPS